MNKQEAIIYINALSEDVDLDITILNKTLTSGEVEELGISRQLLKYYVSTGKIRTVACGKQKRYILDDIKKLKKFKKEGIDLDMDGFEDDFGYAKYLSNREN